MERAEARLKREAVTLGEDPAEVCLLCFIDDVLVGVPPSMAALAWDVFQAEMGTVGLHLAHVSPQTPPADDLARLVDAGWWRPEGIRLLGAPLSGAREWALGTDEFSTRFLAEEIDRAGQLVAEIEALPERVGPQWPAA